MRIINLTIKSFLIALTVFVFSGCDDFLEEDNKSNLTDQNGFDDPEVFDQLVANGYDKLRKAALAFQLDFKGTDIVTRGSIIAGTDELNDYVNLSTANGSVSAQWNNYYDVATAANLAISRVDEIPGLTDQEISKGLGEAKFLRAFAYFNLVEHFGDVPLVLDEITSSETNFSRVSESEVYAQILSDVDEAIASVEENPSQFGRISKNAARHLKARVLLTRGYKSFAGANDFSEAAALAETVISNHPLESDFAVLHDIGNQRNPEVIFALLFGTDAQMRGENGNNRHKLFRFQYDLYPGMIRSELYNNGEGSSPTPFFFTLFEEGDEREDATLRRTLFALVDAEGGSIAVGDTAIFFPKTPWTDEEKAAVDYAVINESDYYTPNGISPVHYPIFKKFDDPAAEVNTGFVEAGGIRDAIIFRSGETVLIAAEAYLEAGDAASAADHLNVLRARAGITSTLLPGDVNIDFILDERARELAGEVSRWMDLKRTGKLIERVLAHNPHAQLNNAIQPFHLLRPIPQSEVDLVTGDGFGQNPGY